MTTKNHVVVRGNRSVAISLQEKGTLRHLGKSVRRVIARTILPIIYLFAGAEGTDKRTKESLSKRLYYGTIDVLLKSIVISLIFAGIWLSTSLMLSIILFTAQLF